MNIISDKILKFLLLRFLFFAFILSNASFSQDNPPTRLKVDISGGYSHSLYNKGSFQFGEYSRNGISGNLRIIWQSEHHLGLGIETGYISLASLKQDNFKNEFGTSNIRANISAIPILADFLFDFGNIFLNTSIGYYYINSRINAFQVKSFSSTFDFGFSFSLGYLYMINKNLGVGAEMKSHHLVDTPQLAFSLQLMLRYNIIDL